MMPRMTARIACQDENTTGRVTKIKVLKSWLGRSNWSGPTQMRSRNPDIGPQMNRRIEMVFSPSCSTGGGIAPAVEDDDVVDGDLDAVGEALQKHRPGLRGLAGGADELSGEAGRIVHRIPQRREIRQRHRAIVPGFGELKRRDLILGGRSGKRLQQRQHAGAGDYRLQQKVLDQARCLQPPPFVAGQLFRRRVLVVVVHNLIKPCWTASNTAS